MFYLMLLNCKFEIKKNTRETRSLSGEVNNLGGMSLSKQSGGFFFVFFLNFI